MTPVKAFFHILGFLFFAGATGAILAHTGIPPFGFTLGVLCGIGALVCLGRLVFMMAED